MDEKTTTWRADDTVWFRAGCHTAEHMIAVGKKVSDEFFMAKVEKGLCFYMPGLMNAVLVKWLDGPFKDDTGSATGSVWEIRDITGRTEFIWIFDTTGPHKPTKDRGA